MARKKWEAKTEITPDLLKFREKRKWQINLRRYVLEKTLCPFYAPYFGLDIENLRRWFEIQFEPGMDWADFGRKWQFEHVIPATYFDFNQDEDLKLCWNFINLRVAPNEKRRDPGSKMDILAAKRYLEDLYQTTHYSLCLKLLEKINKVESPDLASSERQRAFLTENRPYLDMLGTYSRFEFELLNSGRSPEDVKKEIDFLKGSK